MKLLELELELPWLRGPLALKDVPPGALVLLGPNASGKSSLARGMGCLLFEDRQAQGAGRAVWTVRDERVHARFGPGRPLRFEPAAPPLADARWRRLYFLDLDSFRAKEGTEDVAAELRRELGSGYDLSSVGAARRKAWSGRTPLVGARRELSAARQALQRVQAKHATLEAQRGELEELRARRAKAQGAAKRVAELERGLHLLRVLEEGEEAKLRLTALPPELGRLEANDQSLLQRLWDSRAQLEVERVSRAADRERLSQERGALAKVEGLASLVQRVDLLALERDVLGAENERQEAKRRRERLELGEGARPLALGELRELEQLFDQLQGARAELRRLGPKPILESASGSADEPAQSASEEGRAALRRWLEEEPTEGPRAANAWREVAVATLAVLSSLALWLLEQMAAALWVALGGLVLAMVVRAWPQRKATNDHRAREVRRFVETGLAPPVAWTSAWVARRLTELERDAVQSEESRQRTAMTGRLFAEWQSAEAAHGAAKQALENFARARGLPSDTGELGLVELARRMATLGEVLGQIERAEERLARAERAHAQARAELEPRLAAAGVELPGDAFSAQALLESIRTRAERLERVRGELEQVERELAALGARQRGAEDELEKLCARLALPQADPRPRLLELVQLEPAYRKARADKERCESELKHLAPTPEEEEHTRSLGREALVAEREAEQARAGELEECIQNIARIEERLKVAAGGYELEAAWSDVQRSEAELAATAHDGLCAAALEFLLHDVQVEHDRAPRSELLQRAADLLGRFTAGTVELLPPSAADEDSRKRGFRLVTDSGEPRTPEQLSSGTLAQLELALRIAVVERVERGVEPLPLFLDEVLTHSDPTRFAAVAGAICVLTRQGRQVLFATSDPVDAERFARAFEAAGEPRPGIARLGAALPPAPAEWLVYEAPVPVPSPDGLDAAEYGRRLGVPAADGLASVAALHVFHLFRDRLDLVHALSLAHVRTVAQLGHLLARGVRMHADVEREFGPRRAAFEAAWDAFREGRAPKFPPELVVEALGKSTKIEEVLAAAEEFDFDGTLFLERLRAKYVSDLRKSLIAELEQRLEEGGYLPRGEALRGDALVARALDLVPAMDAAERSRAAAWVRMAVLAVLPAPAGGPTT
ncbi:MAG: hypothetical protein GC161_18050 [Planctomycetaceae bacterium]|nr:hypothetical protein [Planctomycetaceae bacterium]